MDRTERVLDFLAEIEKLRTVKRKIRHQDGYYENDAEHTWHMAMFVMLLAPEIDQSADLTKMLKMTLVHDLGEIYAGDIITFDVETKQKHKSIEREAIEKLATKLPEDYRQEVINLYDEFEANITLEAKLVKAIDKIQPMLVNLKHAGRSWKEDGISWKKIHDHKIEYMKFSPKLEKVFMDMLEEAKKNHLTAEDAREVAN